MTAAYKKWLMFLMIVAWCTTLPKAAVAAELSGSCHAAKGGASLSVSSEGEVLAANTDFWQRLNQESPETLHEWSLKKGRLTVSPVEQAPKCPLGRAFIEGSWNTAGTSSELAYSFCPLLGAAAPVAGGFAQKCSFFMEANDSTWCSLPELDKAMSPSVRRVEDSLTAQKYLAGQDRLTIVFTEDPTHYQWHGTLYCAKKSAIISLEGLLKKDAASVQGQDENK